MNSVLIKSPPHAIEAEQAVLGGLMLDPNAYDRIADRLSESDFYRRVGCHVGMAFLATECGYQAPVAVEPEDEKASLMREFIKAQKVMAEMVKRMERLE